MARYSVGDVARLKAVFRFRDDSGRERLADPGTIVVQIKPPSGASVSFTFGVDLEVVRLGLGAYKIEVPLEVAGVWVHRWRGTSPVPVGEEQQFTVLPSVFTNP